MLEVKYWNTAGRSTIIIMTDVKNVQCDSAGVCGKLERNL